MKRFSLALGLAFLAPATAFAASAPPPPAGCSSEESKQFDFWVGAWDVHKKADPDRTVTAHSLIEKLYEGCAVRENWMPLSKHTGGSLNTYIAKDKGWKQFWVDSDGGAAEFTGAWTGGAMVLQGIWPQPGHPDQITRMTYTPLADGSVEQMGETSDDGGKSWQPGFDLIYVKSE
ncbi:MAG: hypothetical protein GC166_14710 [Alphaproteobacteria bacterium]|nr:hypothetical protein [Alphaproteobacteria bacterium]